MKQTLVVPSKPRSQAEEKLLDEIASDQSLQNDDLRDRVQEYLDHQNYALVAWNHRSASMVRYSFEDYESAVSTYFVHRNQNHIPRIVGVRSRTDAGYWVCSP